MSNLRAKVCRALEVLLGLVFLLTVFNLTDSRLLFRLGDGYHEYLIRAIFWIFAIRALLGIPWRVWFLSGPFSARALRLALMAGAGFLSYSMMFFDFTDATTAYAFKRSGYKAPTDEESLRAYFEYTRWYIRASFIEKIKREVPEGASMVYFGDLNALNLGPMLYPRKLYVMPEIQNLVFRNDEMRWASRADPLIKSDPRYEGLPAGFEDPAILEKLRTMLREKKIEWIIVYDSLRPELSYFRKIEPKFD